MKLRSILINIQVSQCGAPASLRSRSIIRLYLKLFHFLLSAHCSASTLAARFLALDSTSPDMIQFMLGF
jgi:hypothetical protein